ncbi:leucine-rich repeat-containing protein kinase family protein [Roseateles cellulosilyticus]|uniref:Protein kinase n=1 Tax=Pelomonas cellulosilytica TaxID=2906762 RepID=A0ABS8XPA6_9BURK|nr:protein kinase [Pelomonas sp. P8]MCE4554591.1 protein kinase [Pelomonas sp. P8]
MNTLEPLRAGALQGATRLTLSAGLRELPDEVYTLADTLEVLDLSGNDLETLPDDLPRLHRLKVLFCSGNRFTRVPEVLGRCEALEMVGFKHNSIEELPAAALPPRLRWLILTDNRLARLPEELGRRPLQKVALAGNRLQALPESLAACTTLELLRISANGLQGLPDGLLQLPRLTWLAHGGNPFSAAHEAEALAQAPVPRVDWAGLRVQALLGEGASGHIHRVDDRDGRPLALKVFKGNVTSDGLPQTELAACLHAGRHPQLIPALGRLSSHPGGADGLLMPLVDARFRTLAAPPSLASCTRDVYDPTLRMPAEAAMRLAARMADALAHLHARGLTHGDLYAHNILHDGHGDARLGDFGAASFLEAVPPRQAALLRAMDVRALGCLLEELVACCDTGLPAPAEAAALAQACQQPDPGARPSAREVADELR